MQKDDELARAVGLTIEPDRNLPDLTMVSSDSNEPVMVTFKAIPTEGLVNETRQTTLLVLATEGGLGEGQVAFVTAFVSVVSGPSKVPNAGNTQDTPGNCFTARTWKEPDRRPQSPDRLYPAHHLRIHRRLEVEGVVDSEHPSAVCGHTPLIGDALPASVRYRMNWRNRL